MRFLKIIMSIYYAEFIRNSRDWLFKISFYLTLLSSLWTGGSYAECTSQAQTTRLEDTLHSLQQQLQDFSSATVANSSDKVMPQTTAFLNQLAFIYQKLGFSEQARRYLEEAASLALSNPAQLALIYAQLSDIALATHQDEQARTAINKSVQLLPADSPALLRAIVLNNLANVQVMEGYYEMAVQSYQQALAFATTAEETAFLIKIRLNLTQSYLKNHQWQSASQVLLNTKAHFAEQLTRSPETKKIENNQQYVEIFNLISTGELALRLLRISEANEKTENLDKLQQFAHESLRNAEQMARTVNNQQLLGYALGYIGQLADYNHELEKAIQVTRQAIFATQQVNSPESLYRWQWQLGKLLHQQQLTPNKTQLDAQIAVYRQAINMLEPIKTEVAMGYRNSSQGFNDSIGAVYFELADLLLQRAQLSDEAEPWLIEARDIIERFKTAELQIYFQDDCIARTSPQRLVTRSPLKTALIYPIMLSDRLELLVNFPTGLRQYQVPVSARQLREQGNEFRFELETRDTQEFLAYSQRFYQWLIAPLMPELKAQAIETLVFIPDGVLRTLPLAALHDGKQFLMERFQLTSAVSIGLTEAQSLPSAPLKILVSGLSEETAGYVALKNVPDEIQFIRQAYPHSVTLLNEQFTLDSFTNVLKTHTFNAIHIASHGQFNSNPRQTFLLTHQGQITMDKLERLVRLSELRQEPLELLTLSACQTAVGDDQAALGLAGVALKAGARSAVASLWSVDDKATVLLMNNFYQNLQQGYGRAKSLQLAQQFLLNQPRYKHPAFWAAFLLIGNWL